MRPSVVLFSSCSVRIVRSTATGAAVAHIGPDAVPLNAEAADLLVSYLRVVKAYFGTAGAAPNFMQALPGLLRLHLLQARPVRHTPVSRAEISTLIAQCGCMADWHAAATH